MQIETYVKSLDALDILVLTGQFFLGVLILKVLFTLFRLSINKVLGISTQGFSRKGSGGKRILIMGDSTAVGTGAKKEADTIAGRLAKDFPKAEIVNVAKNGSLIIDLKRQIELVSNQSFDLIIVSSGGNDVWHMTSMFEITESLLEIFPKLREMSSGNIIFLIYNNIGSAPLFPTILRPLLKKRCLRIQYIIQYIASKSRIDTIELFNEEEDNPFIEAGNNLFAFDGVHPSSAGYALWYRRMWRLMVEKGRRLK